MLLARDLEVLGLVLGVIFWIQTIRHCLTREPASLEKMLWVMFIIAAPGLGAICYFFLRVPRHRC